MTSSRPEYRFLKFWYCIAVFLLVFIIGVSLWPRPPEIFFALAFSDKILHFLAYFVLMGWYIQLAYQTKVRVLLAISFCALGLALEFLQGWGGVRFFDWMDALANSTGVLVALLLGYTRFQRLLSSVEARFP